jgi:hypothetical protein
VIACRDERARTQAMIASWITLASRITSNRIAIAIVVPRLIDPSSSSSFGLLSGAHVA